MLAVKTARRHYEPTVPEPDDNELEDMVQDGVAVAIDGCEGIEPDGYCQHGRPSWLVFLAYI